MMLIWGPFLCENEKKQQLAHKKKEKKKERGTKKLLEHKHKNTKLMKMGKPTKRMREKN